MTHHYNPPKSKYIRFKLTILNAYKTNIKTKPMNIILFCMLTARCKTHEIKPPEPNKQEIIQVISTSETIIKEIKPTETKNE